MYVSFEVLDGHGMRVFVSILESQKGVVSVVCEWCVVGFVSAKFDKFIGGSISEKYPSVQKFSRGLGCFEL